VAARQQRTGVVRDRRIDFTGAAPTMKEQTMDQMQLAFLFTAIYDTNRDQGDADGQRRPLTAEELDARADVLWRWADGKRGLAAWARALGQGWRPRPSALRAPVSPPLADTTAHG
jgi:hypothetical protein